MFIWLLCPKFSGNWMLPKLQMDLIYFLRMLALKKPEQKKAE
jgi:hypothetical protein